MSLIGHRPFPTYYLPFLPQMDNLVFGAKLRNNVEQLDRISVLHRMVFEFSYLNKRITPMVMFDREPPDFQRSLPSQPSIGSLFPHGLGSDPIHEPVSKH